MTNKVRLGVTCLIGLLLAAGLVLVSCGKKAGECSGTGECTITVKQGANGLYVDNDSPKSSCGDEGTYDYEKGMTVGACAVALQNDWLHGATKAGTISCNCASSKAVDTLF
ncbi:MAG: hypothetical protein LBV17_02435 [Treponema sp.]|jgi:hypothetical protein|nr:hypothetical protein [Treponema sp.]